MTDRHTALGDAAITLAIYQKMLPTLAASLKREAVPGHDIAAAISSQYRAALREAARLAEAIMAAAGMGPPPADYAVLMLGSAARG